MNRNIALLSAVLSALALMASGASASTSKETSVSATVPSASSAVEQLARRGRRNDDPVGGEDAGCDDHGTDLCAIKLSKHGADDAPEARRASAERTAAERRAVLLFMRGSLSIG